MTEKKKLLFYQIEARGIRIYIRKWALSVKLGNQNKPHYDHCKLTQGKWKNPICILWLKGWILFKHGWHSEVILACIYEREQFWFNIWLFTVCHNANSSHLSTPVDLHTACLHFLRLLTTTLTPVIQTMFHWNNTNKDKCKIPSLSGVLFSVVTWRTVPWGHFIVLKCSPTSFFLIFFFLFSILCTLLAQKNKP